MKPGVLPSALYRPLFWNCSSLRRVAAATRLRTFTCAPPSNTTPLRLTIITVPSALIWPWICEGRAFGSLTRFSTAQFGSWRNCTVVLRPTLKVSQFRMAFSPVCSMATLTRPLAAVCTGALALRQPAVRDWRPP